MANSMTFEQISGVMEDIAGQVTGKDDISITNTNEFVNVCQLALSVGYDPLLNAISQVLSRTIFSVRPYTGKFKGLSVSNERYGMITRKIVFADQPMLDDPRYELEDGQSVDMYKVRKPSAMQFNFYGAQPFMYTTTIFKDQLDSAFSDAAQFGSFVSAQLSNINDKVEQSIESMARMTIGNLMAGVISERNNSPQVVHLLTEFNTEKGLELTYEQVMGPQYYSVFWPWVFGKVKKIAAMLTERLVIHHFNVTGKPAIPRHTPYANQHIYINQGYMYDTAAQLLPFAFSGENLQVADYEGVNFWQSPEKPYQIDIAPSVLDMTTGNSKVAAEVNKDHILGIIFDDEAAGQTTVNQWQATTPMNTTGGYWNTDWHWTQKWWNDFTENAVVLVID